MKKYFPLILLIAVLLTGCANATDAETPEVIATIAPTETPLPEATLTSVPEIPLALLILPVDMDQETSDIYQTLVYELAQSSGMRFQVRNTLTVEDLIPSLRVVIALPPDPGLMALAPAAPQAQFLSVNIPDMVAGGNLSVLADTDRPDIVAFLSGYIAAMITQDYHTGLMIPKDDIVGQKMLTAFHAGVDYYCGLCQPWAGPFYDYPLYVEIPADAPQNEYNAYADYLINHTVETMYLPPQFATPELLTYLSSSGTLVISDFSPSRKYGNWVVSIQPDVINAIQTSWANLVAGNGGMSVMSPLVLTDVNFDLKDEAKQQAAQDVLVQLQAGYILTGVNP